MSIIVINVPSSSPLPLSLIVEHSQDMFIPEINLSWLIYISLILTANTYEKSSSSGYKRLKPNYVVSEHLLIQQILS